NCVASREASAREAGIELESALTPVVGVEGDPVRLSQVVMNLVGNAIQYTPSGGHVRVTLWQSGAQVVLAVTDTGRGVGATDVERMFKPFVRLGDGGALGVGLAIARHIVQAHGGSIHAASAGQDLGTTVTVAIPASGMRTSIPVHRRWFHIAGRQAALPGVAH
ncbi:MAG: HAMP domain-containing histidine kinase, partial [Deltaproteobacteria bacterium]